MATALVAGAEAVVDNARRFAARVASPVYRRLSDVLDLEGGGQ